MNKTNDFSFALVDILSQYSEDINRNIDTGLQIIGRETVKELKNNSNIPTKSGDYKKKFYLTKKDGNYVVANRKYQLTHLLEKGHAKKNGGRTKAFPHWAEAEKSIIKKADVLLKSIGGV